MPMEGGHRAGPCLPPPAPRSRPGRGKTLMNASHKKAHAMESGQGAKKNDNYDCCALCLDRDASRQTLQGRKKRHKTTGLGRTVHTGQATTL